MPWFIGWVEEVWLWTTGHYGQRWSYKPCVLDCVAMVCLCQLMLQSTRDEHLLLGVAALMLLDLAIVLPWQLIDPITCHISTWKTVNAFSPKIIVNNSL